MRSSSFRVGATASFVAMVLGAFGLLPAMSQPRRGTGVAPPIWAKAAAEAARPWMNRSLSPEERANLLIQKMTLDEKIAMLHGAKPCLQRRNPACRLPIKGYVGYVPPIPRLGIPALTLADGRAGVGNKARDVTLLPAPIAAALELRTGIANCR